MSTATDAPSMFLRPIARPEAVKRVRNEVTAAARGWGLDTEQLETLQLLVSELVTNTLYHAEGQAIEVRAERRRECVVLDVWDPAPSIPKADASLEMPEAMAERGRGLPLVELLTSWWYEQPSVGGRGGKHLIAHVPLADACGCAQERPCSPPESPLPL